VCSDIQGRELANPREQELDGVLASNAFGFCPGGAIAGLTVAAEGLAPRGFFSEIDDNAAAVWKTIFSERTRTCCGFANAFERS